MFFSIFSINKQYRYLYSLTRFSMPTRFEGKKPIKELKVLNGSKQLQCNNSVQVKHLHRSYWMICGTPQQSEKLQNSVLVTNNVPSLQYLPQTLSNVHQENWSNTTPAGIIILLDVATEVGVKEFNSNNVCQDFLG